LFKHRNVRSLIVKNIYERINHSTIRFLDHSTKTTIFNEPYNALASFAIDDAIATTVGNSLAPPTVRTWVHDRTVVLGIPDSRLPYLEKGVKYLKNLGFQVLIRNSGGLAVLIDKGVLNISLILPGKNELSIHDGYQIMYHFIQYLFKDYTSDIKAFEIKGSYCPGDYDLSINGVKFAGISQRRVRNGVAVQVYLDVEGSSKKRASTIKQFYEMSTQRIVTKHTYPDVNPNVMGTISELLQQNFTVQLLIHKMMQHLQIQDIESVSMLDAEAEIFNKRYDQMQKRNEKLALIL